MNYELVFETGDLYPGSGFVKATAKGLAKDGEIKELPGAKSGYGATQRNAVDDWLRRNKDETIDLVFKENK